MNIVERTCPVCKNSVQSGQEFKYCQQCGSAYHTECWPSSNECVVCPDSRKPSWGFTDIILVYIGIMVTGILYGLLVSRLPSAINKAFGSAQMSNFVISFLIQFVVTVGLVYFFAVFMTRSHWTDLGVRPAHFRSYIKYGIGGGFLLIILVIIMGQVIQHIQPELSPQYYEQMLRSASGFRNLLMVIIAGAVLAPLSEELFYRGMIYPVFRKHLGPLWGAILAGTIFGLAHWDVWRTIPLAIGGAILCYIYEKTGSILVSALAHGVWNGTMSLVVYWSITSGF